MAFVVGGFLALYFNGKVKVVGGSGWGKGRGGRGGMRKGRGGDGGRDERDERGSAGGEDCGQDGQEQVVIGLWKVLLVLAPLLGACLIAGNLTIDHVSV